MCVKLLQLQHKRATYILFEFKSSLKRESETRVNEAKSVGEENVKFLFLGLFRINFTPAFSRFSTSKSQSCWGPNQCWEQVRKPYTCTLPMRLAKACPSENGKFRYAAESRHGLAGSSYLIFFICFLSWFLTKDRDSVNLENILLPRLF